MRTYLIINKMYYKFSTYLKNTYGQKVYKIPINAQVTCPNRDGKKDTSGCIFCSEEGTAFESFENYVPIKKQLLKNMTYIGEKYNAKKFIAYFQNYSNTYLPLNKFTVNIKEVLHPDVVAIYIATRPDCIDEKQLIFLSEISKQYKLDIVIEMGLQSTKNSTLTFLNRHHTYEDFVTSTNLIKSYGLKVCAHMINDLPNETIGDVITSAKSLSYLKVDQVKCHSLYILKNTKLGEMYNDNLFKMGTVDEFIMKTIGFLENLDKNIVVQRLIGRAPKEKTLFCNYGRNWRYVVNQIENIMAEENIIQGSKTENNEEGILQK